jgi:cell division protein FtsW
MQALRFDPDTVQRRFDWDEPLLIAVALLATGGFVMMGSASMDYAAEQFGNPFYHIVRHGIYLTAGLVVLLVTLRIPVALWQRAAQPLLVGGLILLAVLLVPGIGREVNGATRWIGFGLFNVQPSELMKLFFVVYLASYIPRRREELQQRFFGMAKPLGLLGLVMILLLLEPDFGSAVVIAGTTLGMLFIGGARLLPFAGIVAIGLLGAGVLAVASPYRMQRLVTYLDPWADQFSSGYQLTQALIAFGRGELFGVGLGNSVQKLFYLPEAHTDFVFAIVAEELGLLGALVFIVLFAALVARILWIARAAARRQQFFAAHACMGIALLIAAQVFINIGVNAGLLPTKGLTLPFLSYGGSSLLILFAMIGLVARVEHETRQPAVAGASPGWRSRDD